MSTEDLGFTFRETKAGALIIYHHAKQATILRGTRAQKTGEDLDSLSFAEQQQLMARLTGNYRRGNEKSAKRHPRNRR